MPICVANLELIFFRLRHLECIMYDLNAKHLSPAGNLEKSRKVEYHNFDIKAIPAKYIF